MIDDLIKQLDSLLDKYYVKIIGENQHANKRRNELLDVVKDFHCDILTILQSSKSKDEEKPSMVFNDEEKEELKQIGSKFILCARYKDVNNLLLDQCIEKFY